MSSGKEGPAIHAHVMTTGFPAPLADIVLAYVQPRIAFYIMGGFGDVRGKSTSDYLKDAYGWSVADEAWIPLPAMKDKRSLGGFALASGMLFAMGGIPQNGNQGLSRTEMLRLEALSSRWAEAGKEEEAAEPEEEEEEEEEERKARKKGEHGSREESGTWTQLPEMAAGRHAAFAAALGGRLYVFEATNVNAVAAEFLTRSGWQEDKQFSEHLPTSIGSHALCAIDHRRSRVYVIPFTGALGRIWDAVERKWELNALPKLPGNYIPWNGGATFLNNTIYVCGSGKLMALDLVNKERGWQEQPMGFPVPAGLGYFTLLPYEGQLYVFGGDAHEQYRDTVYRYDPASMQWETMPQMALPMARLAFVGVSHEQEGTLDEETLAAVRQFGTRLGGLGGSSTT